jgi:glycosyltransferase involved in cell wall biosynthesis
MDVPDPLISCLCVTRARVTLLSRAVRCFLDQSHPSRELLIVFDADDTATRQYVDTLADERIRGIEVPVSPRRSLGSLRNLAVAEARGQYICQWDDDDWYHPDRLTAQLSALRASGRPACVLSRWTCVDVEARRAYISPHRIWEGSILIERERMVEYPDLARGEDTVALNVLSDRQHLHMLDRPELYVYTFHGSNTWDRTHWSNVLGHSTVMPWNEAQEVLARSGVDVVRPRELPMREHLAPTRYWFDRACQRATEPLQTSYFRFAGAPVRMRVLGSALNEKLKQSYAQLLAHDVNADGPFALTIDAWDRATTGLGCPGVPMPPDQTQLLDEGLITFYGNGRIIRYERGHYVNTLDRTSGEIFTWRNDGKDLALYERAKPFPNELEVWYRDQGVQQLHAGLVSLNGKGVLFIGQSGSGKSTCTLACALDGFDYLGDDHNGLQMTSDGRCIGHSYYNAARIGPGHLEHFPELRAHELPPHNQYDHKSLVFMTQATGRVVSSCEIVAVIMPRIVPDGPTKFRRASKVQTLIALAPSTLKVPMGGGFGGFMNLTEFIPRMSCFVLECGPDVRAIPGCVREILEQAAGGQR